MADLFIAKKQKLHFCWRCGWHTLEFISWRKLWQDKARCFYCRIDALDKKHGPSLQAELNRGRDGTYRIPGRTKWGITWQAIKPHR